MTTLLICKLLHLKTKSAFVYSQLTGTMIFYGKKTVIAHSLDKEALRNLTTPNRPQRRTVICKYLDDFFGSNIKLQ